MSRVTGRAEDAEDAVPPIAVGGIPTLRERDVRERFDVPGNRFDRLTVGRASEDRVLGAPLIAPTALHFGVELEVHRDLLLPPKEVRVRPEVSENREIIRFLVRGADEGDVGRERPRSRVLSRVLVLVLPALPPGSYGRAEGREGAGRTRLCDSDLRLCEDREFILVGHGRGLTPLGEVALGLESETDIGSEGVGLTSGFVGYESEFPLAVEEVQLLILVLVRKPELLPRVACGLVRVNRPTDSLVRGAR